MPPVSSLHPFVAPWVAIAVLVLGAWLAHALQIATGEAIAGRSMRRAAIEPLRRAALLQIQRSVPTERPDRLLRVLAPALYAAAACAALTVVPLHEHVAIADVRAGIVLFGAAEAFVIVAIFMHGWSPNSHLALIGGYRFVALGLSYGLVSMFVLIAAALPAQSLQVSAIVRSQAELWNVLRQPLGLPLWLIVTWGVASWGPLDLADGRDLAGGASVEDSGRVRLLWQIARGGTLTVWCGMGAAVFFGGWLGPGLPGWAWMLLKTTAVMIVVVGLGHVLGRVLVERAVLRLWTVGLPLAFVHLGLAGLEALA